MFTLLTLLICSKIILVLINKQSLWGFSPNRISPIYFFTPYIYFSSFISLL